MFYKHFLSPEPKFELWFAIKLIFRHHLSNHLTNDNFLLYLYNCPMFPLSIKVPDNKTDCTYYPVDHHCNPHAKYSQSHIFSYQITESDPEIHIDTIDVYIQAFASPAARYAAGRANESGQIIIALIPWK